MNSALVVEIVVQAAQQEYRRKDAPILWRRIATLCSVEHVMAVRLNVQEAPQRLMDRNLAVEFMDVIIGITESSERTT